MLIFNLSRVLKLRGIDLPYAFLVRKGFARQTASNLINNRVSNVKIKHLDSLCRILQCTPNDLFEWRADANERLEENHPLQSLRREQSAEPLRDIINQLPLEKMEKLQAMINELKSEN